MPQGMFFGFSWVLELGICHYIRANFKMPKVGRVLRNAPPQNGRLGPSHPTGQESHPYLKFGSYEIILLDQYLFAFDPRFIYCVYEFHVY